MIHVSNLYYTEEQATFAKRLVELSPHDKVFFANSGAGANEGAIKLARKYTGKGEIIATIALFGFGSSFIKGFSITLIVGILCSIFTSVNISRMIIEEIFNKGRRKKMI